MSVLPQAPVHVAPTSNALQHPDSDSPLLRPSCENNQKSHYSAGQQPNDEQNPPGGHRKKHQASIHQPAAKRSDVCEARSQDPGDQTLHAEDKHNHQARRLSCTRELSSPASASVIPSVGVVAAELSLRYLWDHDFEPSHCRQLTRVTCDQ